MAHKRRLTAHQKQIRFIAILAGVVLMIGVVAVILALSQPVGGYPWLRRLVPH